MSAMLVSFDLEESFNEQVIAGYSCDGVVFAEIPPGRGEIWIKILTPDCSDVNFRVLFVAPHTPLASLPGLGVVIPV